MRRLKTVRRPPIYPKTPGHLPCSSLTHPLPLSSRRPSVSFGGFGLRAKTALNGSIELSQLVEVRSEAVDGWFSVKTLVHRGDNWGGEFVTEIEGTKHEPAAATQQPVAIAPVPLPGGRA